jgi:hypothetical protein
MKEKAVSDIVISGAKVPNILGKEANTDVSNVPDDIIIG